MRFLILFLVISLVACDTSKEKKNPIDTQTHEEFVMYEPSEMTKHMNFMYAYNQGLKEKILSGDTLPNFTKEFLKIYTATLTNNKEKNQRFKVGAESFIKSQQKIFLQKDSLAMVKQYNKTINSCIDCHQTECTGPIPKIKKLLIH